MKNFLAAILFPLLLATCSGGSPAFAVESCLGVSLPTETIVERMEIRGSRLVEEITGEALERALDFYNSMPPISLTVEADRAWIITDPGDPHPYVVLFSTGDCWRGGIGLRLQEYNKIVGTNS